MKESNRLGKSTIVFKNKPRIESTYSIVGQKEGQGPFRNYFDCILNDDLCGKKTYELAEREILERTILGALDKNKVDLSDIDFNKNYILKSMPFYLIKVLANFFQIVKINLS